ncbi:bifunctional transcriptional activator/DNA repair enzyme AdaA [Siminovitchia terrae]|uniref:bifunctional transcriptional activator/DNA repair enzyme AdaA n=1 Tax=Siminovitchia terrae TaxID=1914933 RepID=UPI001B1A5341|nr:bifunctional transcriptional activator/DNA repair enzyme AdaA [Siminovitchia terrae]GIN92845.1 AraC family transcriptional regulator [Siminovitchia terrae]
MQEYMWEAIVQCDRLYDGKFFYGLTTTKIFCRPSCKSRTPKRENTKVFSSVSEAITSGFRPCKRCKPEKLKAPDEEIAHNAKTFIHNHFNESITLSKIAEEIHINPYHLHRTFKKIVGKTPSDYLFQIRIKLAKEMLKTTDKSITEIALKVGYYNISHFSSVFLDKVGMNPSEFRRQHSTSALLGDEDE